MPPHAEIPDTVYDTARTTHMQDSTALAEQLRATDLDTLLRLLGEPPTTNGRLGRAWLRVEYALATPDLSGDRELLDDARADVQSILRQPLERLGWRNKIRVNAALLYDYLPVFKRRAGRQIVDQRMQDNLRVKIGGRINAFLYPPQGDMDLKPGDYGLLDELIALYGLLGSSTFPYLASVREESNAYRDDNHDLYSIHPCARNVLKKACTSIKHTLPGSLRGEPLHQIDKPVLTIGIGTVALQLANMIGYPGKNRTRHWAARAIADIMASHSQGDHLDSTDQRFLRMMSDTLEGQVAGYANSFEGPDYSKNFKNLEAYLGKSTSSGTYHEPNTNWLQFSPGATD